MCWTKAEKVCLVVVGVGFLSFVVGVIIASTGIDKIIGGIMLFGGLIVAGIFSFVGFTFTAGDSASRA